MKQQKESLKVCDITPGTLVNWLNTNSGFFGKSPSLIWEALTKFTNAARNNGYNNGLSMSLAQYRQRSDPNLDANQKRLLLEGALASRYPVMLRVPSGYKTVDNEDGRDGHTILAYGLVPDFASNVSGTYQVNDPGVSTVPPNLWRRVVGNSNWKGKWLYGVAAKPVSGSVVLPNTVRIVLHSPGKIYVEGAVSHYKIGYADGVNFTNAFPGATYEYINPNLDFEPGVDNAPVPPPAEDIQVIRIQGRPDEPLDVKVVGTGTGSYTLTIDEEVWRNQNLEKVHTQEKTGTLSPGQLVTASIPSSGYGVPAQSNTPPKITWFLIDGATQEQFTGNYNIVSSVIHPWYPYLLGQKRAFPVGSRLIYYAEDYTPQMTGYHSATAWNAANTQYISSWPNPNGVDNQYSKSGRLNLNQAGIWDGSIDAEDASGNFSRIGINIHVGEYISITQQPISQAKIEGEGFSVSVSVTANPEPTYQWYKNGVPIPGATGQSFSKSGLVPNDFGQYHCVVKQFSGNQLMSEATSLSAQLDIIPANPPVVDRLWPLHLVKGGICKILGSNFGYNKESVRVVVNGRKIPVGKTNGSEIQFRVPSDLGVGNAIASVEVYGISSASQNTRIVPNIGGTILKARRIR